MHMQKKGKSAVDRLQNDTDSCTAVYFVADLYVKW